MPESVAPVVRDPAGPHDCDGHAPGGPDEPSARPHDAAGCGGAAPEGPVTAPGAVLARRTLGAPGGAGGEPGHPDPGRPGIGAILSQIALGLICAGYTTGASLGWGSPELALFMGDFGLSVAALTAAVSCFLYARAHRGSARPAWLLFAFSSFMASAGNAVWGWYEVVLRTEVPDSSVADLFFLLFAPPAIASPAALPARCRCRASPPPTTRSRCAPRPAST